MLKAEQTFRPISLNFYKLNLLYQKNQDILRRESIFLHLFVR
jgi:hypothetical protein